MDRRFSLEQVEIATPCQADWSSMSGDDQKRFCTHCQKHVHNLSAMTRSAAEELVCRNAGSMCVQFQKDATGTMVTLDYAPVVTRKWWMRWGALAGIAAMASSALAFVGFAQQAPPPVAGGIRPMGQMIAPSERGDMVIKGEVTTPPPTTAPSSQPSDSQNATSDE